MWMFIWEKYTQKHDFKQTKFDVQLLTLRLETSGSADTQPIFSPGYKYNLLAKFSIEFFDITISESTKQRVSYFAIFAPVFRAFPAPLFLLNLIIAEPLTNETLVY